VRDSGRELPAPNAAWLTANQLIVGSTIGAGTVVDITTGTRRTIDTDRVKGRTGSRFVMLGEVEQNGPVPLVSRSIIGGHTRAWITFTGVPWVTGIAFA
jgi:hypothetical protein